MNETLEVVVEPKRDSATLREDPHVENQSNPTMGCRAKCPTVATRAWKRSGTGTATVVAIMIGKLIAHAACTYAT